MADKSPIEWTDATWNPIRGCSRVSEGCRHCYAEGVAARFSGPDLPYEGLARRVSLPGGGSEARWTGKIAYAGDATLQQPLKWRRPRRIFVNSMSDLFHENVPDAIIDRIFAVMALCPQHTFQILTKRPERMLKYLAPFDSRRADGLGTAVLQLGFEGPLEALPWPLPNVWLGVSVEDQVTAETRIPYLLQTPASMRFLSCEPLLGPVDLTPFGMAVHHHPGNKQSPHLHAMLRAARRAAIGPIIDWVIVGGESGPSARAMHPQWARSLRDQCTAAGVPFFFKQWGEWRHRPDLAHLKPMLTVAWQRTSSLLEGVRPALMVREGKRTSGRELDGRTHDEFPL